jgi:GNAT superfamily N-acetyltransferase
MKIQKMKQEDEGFWQLMGPYLVSNDVRKELGMAISSDTSYTWFLAVEDGKCIGFCAAKEINSATYFKGPGLEFRHRYVDPDRRGNGIGKKLMEARLKFAEGRNVKATVTPDSQPTYEKLGFKKVFQRGQYPLMVRIV